LSSSVLTDLNIYLFVIHWSQKSLNTFL